MSNASVFQIVTNDGRQDRMIMATQILLERIDEIKKIRAANGLDPTPTLMDIEKTHLIFMNSYFKPFVAMGFEYFKIIPIGTPQLGGSVRFSLPQYGDFISDMAVYIKLKAPVLTKGSGVSPILPGGRWCNYPGERLLKKTKFVVNGNPMDEYTSEFYNVFRELYIGNTKRAGWNRLVGQETLREGFLAYKTASAGDASTFLPEGYKVNTNIVNGYQTLKNPMEDLEVTVPILFWFCTDPSMMLPSIAIPYGQRFLTIDLATQAELCEVVARGGDANPTMSNIQIEKMELYVNNVFCVAEVHDIYIRRIGFQLVRLHIQDRFLLQTNKGKLLAKELKYPIEHISLGCKTVANLATMDKWQAFSDFSSTTTVNMTGVVGSASTVDTTAASVATPITVVNPTINVQLPVRLVDTISVEAHGIRVYDDFSTTFYNSYIPTVYGAEKITPPADGGLCFITFCLKPGFYQPSGHYNFSRAREFYFEYTSSTISTNNPAYMYLIASALNFLLIFDGSAVMRYTT
jgi:hypothetical protein